MCITNEPQTEIHFRQTTTLTPGQLVAELTDFGPGRSQISANSADEYLKVHHRGSSEADVTPGSSGICSWQASVVESRREGFGHSKYDKFASNSSKGVA